MASVARTAPPPDRPTCAPTRPPRRRTFATRSSFAAVATSGNRRPHWTSSTQDHSLCSPASVPGQESDTRRIRQSKPRAPVVAGDCVDEGRARAQHETVGGGATVRATDAAGYLFSVSSWSAEEDGYSTANTII